MCVTSGPYALICAAVKSFDLCVLGGSTVEIEADKQVQLMNVFNLCLSPEVSDWVYVRVYNNSKDKFQAKMKLK